MTRNKDGSHDPDSFFNDRMLDTLVAMAVLWCITIAVVLGCLVIG